MQIAIIGAGMAGLAAARELRQRRPDATVTLYEKSRGVGGRVATRRRDGYIFDHGAQVFRAPDEPMQQLIHTELAADGLFDIGRPVWLFDQAGAIVPGDPLLNAEPQWAYTAGINQLAKRLAADAEVRREVRVAALRRVGDAWRIQTEDGSDVGQADMVLLTAPGPQSAAIVAASDLAGDLRLTLAAELERAVYRRCLTLTLAYDQPIDRPFYALLNSDRQHPIAWIGLEHAKGDRRCPAGHSLLIAQLAPQASTERWHVAAPDLAAEVAEWLSGVLGVDLRRPLWHDRQGWRFALPDAAADAQVLAAGSEAGLFFAGDFLTGQGRVHLAIESGRRAGIVLAQAGIA
ncbi:MAG TPA: FAD-dependent oxidoreductase [Roseiflexaceae bacterium]|nr:FAD-dependent oxidoreductase [Roseiflexaceae bacterium]